MWVKRNWTPYILYRNPLNTTYKFNNFVLYWGQTYHWCLFNINSIFQKLKTRFKSKYIALTSVDIYVIFQNNQILLIVSWAELMSFGWKGNINRQIFKQIANFYPKAMNIITFPKNMKQIFFGFCTKCIEFSFF
jgi:hypothetical protein